METKETGFSQRLKEIRDQLGYTQEKFAEKLCCSRVAYAYYEAGKRTPGIDFLYRLEESTKYPLDYLLGFSDNETSESVGLDKSLGLSSDSILQLKRHPILQKTTNRLLESGRAAEVSEFLSMFNHYDACRLLVEKENIGKEANITFQMSTETFFSVASGILRQIFQSKDETDSYWGDMPTVQELENNIRNESEHPTVDRIFGVDPNYLKREKFLLEATKRRGAEQHGKEAR
jgi:transcriptional regulator with XRE-family HTH domain